MLELGSAVSFSYGYSLTNGPHTPRLHRTELKFSQQGSLLLPTTPEDMVLPPKHVWGENYIWNWKLCQLTLNFTRSSGLHLCFFSAFRSSVNEFLWSPAVNATYTLKTPNSLSEALLFLGFLHQAYSSLLPHFT